MTGSRSVPDKTPWEIDHVYSIEKHEAVCNPCGSLIALTRKELEERASGYAVIVDGRIVQMTCETCKREFRVRKEYSSETMKGDTKPFTFFISPPYFSPFYNPSIRCIRFL
jgi:hypothetical protein